MKDLIAFSICSREPYAVLQGQVVFFFFFREPFCNCISMMINESSSIGCFARVSVKKSILNQIVHIFFCKEHACFYQRLTVPVTQIPQLKC
jgi:hypothetical protein